MFERITRKDPRESLTYEEEIDDLFNDIVTKIKSGQTVWFPRIENPDIIDLFKYKKYQGCVRLEDVTNELYSAFKSDPMHPGKIPERVTVNPVKYDVAARELLNQISED